MKQLFSRRTDGDLKVSQDSLDYATVFFFHSRPTRPWYIPSRTWAVTLFGFYSYWSTLRYEREWTGGSYVPNLTSRQQQAGSHGGRSPAVGEQRGSEATG